MMASSATSEDSLISKTSWRSTGSNTSGQQSHRGSGCGPALRRAGAGDAAARERRRADLGHGLREGICSSEWRGPFFYLGSPWPRRRGGGLLARGLGGRFFFFGWVPQKGVGGRG